MPTYKSNGSEKHLKTPVHFGFVFLLFNIGGTTRGVNDSVTCISGYESLTRLWAFSLKVQQMPHGTSYVFAHVFAEVTCSYGSRQGRHSCSTWWCWPYMPIDYRCDSLQGTQITTTEQQTRRISGSADAAQSWRTGTAISALPFFFLFNILFEHFQYFSKFKCSNIAVQQNMVPF